MVDAGEIKATAAYEIAKLQFADDQREVAQAVVAGDLDHKATVAAVARHRSASGGEKGKSRGVTNKPKMPRKAASRFDRPIVTASGYKVTLERRKKGVDLLAIVEALEEVLAIARGELATAGEDAA